MRRRSAKSKSRRPKAKAPAAGKSPPRRAANFDALDRVAAIAIIFFLQFSIAIRPFAPGATGGPGANFLVELPIIFAFSLWLISMALKREFRFAMTRLEIPIVIFLILVVTSIFTASYKRPSFILAIDWVSFIILFFTVVNIGGGERVVRLLLAVLVASAFVVSLYGLYQRFGIQSEIVEALEEFKDKARDKFPNDEAAAASYVVSGLGRSFGVYIPPESLIDFEGRVRSGEVYSTFILANNLAGFLILVFPVQLGFLLERLRRPLKDARSASAAGIMAAAIIASLVCLYLTGSKGGWISLILGMIVFWALWARGIFGGNVMFRAIVEQMSRRKRTLAIAALVVLLAISSAQVTGKLPKLGDYLGSMAIRTDYWRSAWKIIRGHPWLGVGLDNYGIYSTAYKGPEDGESRMAHNDFIQIWAETGLFGFLAYCSIWITFLILFFGRRRAFRLLGRFGAPKQEVQPMDNDRSAAASHIDGGPSHLWIVGLAAGSCAFFFSYVAQLGFEVSSALALLFCAAWLAAYASFASATPAAEPSQPPKGAKELDAAGTNEAVTDQSARTDRRIAFSSLRCGIIAGLFCFLIHSTVDFDLYVHGIAQNVWMFTGLALVAKSDWGAGLIRLRRRASVTSQVVVALAATLLVAAFALVLVPRAFTAQIYLESGERLYANGKDKEAVRAWTKAVELDPGNATLHEYLAMPHIRKLRTLVQSGKAGEGLAGTHIKSAIEHISQAIELTPRSAKYHSMLGELYEYDRRTADAIREHEKATQLFPSKPIYWRRLGRVYHSAGRLEEAKKAYIRALDLNKRQRYPRNELSARERKAVEKELALVEEKMAKE